MEHRTLLIQIARDEYLSQEGLNLEFSLKAIGIITFSITAYGVVMSLLFPESKGIDIYGWTILVGISISLAISIIAAIVVLFPKDWQRPLYVEDLKEAAEKYNEYEINKGVGIAYSNAIHHNSQVLKQRAKWLQLLTYATAAQFILYAVFFVYLFFPGIRLCSLFSTG